MWEVEGEVEEERANLELEAASCKAGYPLPGDVLAMLKIELAQQREAGSDGTQRRICKPRHGMRHHSDLDAEDGTQVALPCCHAAMLRSPVMSLKDTSNSSILRQFLAR